MARIAILAGGRWLGRHLQCDCCVLPTCYASFCMRVKRCYVTSRRKQTAVMRPTDPGEIIRDNRIRLCMTTKFHCTQIGLRPLQYHLRFQDACTTALASDSVVLLLVLKWVHRSFLSKHRFALERQTAFEKTLCSLPCMQP